MLSSPLFLIAGVAAVAAVVVAHLLIVRDRAPAPLPTTRFVPGVARAAAIFQRRPHDLALLVMRAGALLLAAIGLAGLVVRGGSRSPVTIVAADLANAADPRAAFDSARSLAGGDGRVVLSDSVVRIVGARDDFDLPAAPSAVPLALTPAMIAAIREAVSLGGRGHPVEIVLVSPLLADGIDSATQAVRALWPASMRLVQIAPLDHPTIPGARLLRAPADDPLRAALALLPVQEGGAVHVVRGELTPDDSASAVAGGTIVHWPATSPPGGFRPRNAMDTTGGVTAGPHLVIARFSRRWEVAVDGNARVTARWIDGEPAAVERSLGDGCIREIAIEVPDIGDLVISREFLRFVQELSRPCGAHAVAQPMSREARAMLEGSGPALAMMRPAGMILGRSSLAIAFLSAALLLLLGELALRRRRRS